VRFALFYVVTGMAINKAKADTRCVTPEHTERFDRHSFVLSFFLGWLITWAGGEH